MFVDCSQLIAGNRPGLYNGVSVADADGDGRCEVLVAGDATANLVLKWDGDRLVDIADPVLADAGRRALSIAAADVDGDGREEIYVVNAAAVPDGEETCDRLFANFGERWLDLFSQAENAGAANRLPARSVAAIDREGRGRYGFLVAGDGSPLRLFELHRRGRLVDVAEEAGIDLIAHGRGLLCAPLLGDATDIVAVNEAGPNFLFHNLGDGTFEELAGERGLADSRIAGRGAVPVDADGEALQVLIASWEGPQRLYQQRSGGGFVDIANADLSMPARARTVIAADFDNDGHVELFFNAFGERNRLFAWRDDQWTEVECGDATLPRGFGTGAAVADIDGDGRLELIVVHGETAAQPPALFRPMPNKNAWLRVQPLTPYGAPARGALVTCTAGGRRQRRVVCGGSGYLCQMEPVAHFGLGTVHAVDQVEVRWPDGVVVTIDQPPVGRVLTVQHPPE
ncbi:CRTAC1 family protein [Azospirillum halopraeferens]|uniref:CRTAC1 family protein n=1 Tax=Azospirillum halopraeferens TaxID=34010 RepID=UPI00041005E7|nr:CRTAC1 family protein [Azospirillum halopraeferens]